MPASVVNDASILVLDIGNVNTRAVLFDVVEGRYRFIAYAEAPSTAVPPVADLMVGVRQVLEILEEKTGRALLQEGGMPILPATADGQGIDQLAAVLSAGPLLKVAVAGLLEDVSVSSVRRLAETLYAQSIDVFHINDERDVSEQLDALAARKPDLLLVAGGTDGGATRALKRLFEVLGLGAYLASVEKRPTILYAGNRDLAELARKAFDPVAENIYIAPNLRPSLDVENLLPAATELAHSWPVLQSPWLNGLDELMSWTQGQVLPTNFSQGRTIRLLGAIYNSRKGVMSVDVGAASATFHTAYGKTWRSKTLPLGLGDNLMRVLKSTSLERIQRWLPLDIPRTVVQDYLYNKVFYPDHVPVSKEAAALEQAVAREILWQGVQAVVQDVPPEALSLHPALLPQLEPIFAAGEVFTSAPTPGQALLTLLDGLQPVGVTTFVLDDNDLLAALGVVGELNTLAAAQVLETAAFTTLATVISPLGTVRQGAPALKVTMMVENGDKTSLTVKQGGLEVLSLAPGQRAKVRLEPMRGVNVGFGPGRGHDITVSGSLLGIVIDARGRPLNLPEDPVRRRELMKKWLWALGG